MRVLMLLLALCVSGCATIGPTTILHDRFDYAAAISDSWKDQMLLNLVKARYGDVPVFLDIASAINSYSIESGVSAEAALPSPLGGSNRTFTVGGASKFTDRPTISYNPLLGDKFSKSLMTPIPPGSLLSLMQSGWSAEMLLRCCVHSVNGLQNYSRRTAFGHAGDPEFVRLTALMVRVQQEGGVGLRAAREKDPRSSVLLVPQRRGQQQSPDVDEVKRLLGLDAAGLEYPVVYGSSARDGREVAILTRSMLDVLLDMSSYIEVPRQHVAERRAAPGYADLPDAFAGHAPLLRVQSGLDRPADAFVAIRYRSHWFWIDDRDLFSKGVFSFLMFLFTLSESSGGPVTPVITVPAG
jgi:hypothetical protein